MKKIIGQLEVHSEGPLGVIIKVDVENVTTGWQWKSGNKGGHVDTLDQLADAVLDAHRIVPKILQGPDALMEAAWGIIANVGNGDWKTQTPEWAQAAQEWRESYHLHLGIERTKTERNTLKEEQQPMDPHEYADQTNWPSLRVDLRKHKLEHLIDDRGNFRTLDGKHLWHLIRDYKMDIPEESMSPIFCGHANESPHVCTCRQYCYCRVTGNCGRKDKHL